MNASKRDIVYLTNILLGVLSVVAAVLVVGGVVQQSDILAGVAIAGALWSVFAGLLARMNLTPDEGTPEE